MVTLEILRGKTRFPERPIFGERFLIGSGLQCDLRLGGRMPHLHSIILVRPDETLIETCGQPPALRVNDRIVDCASLCDGDVVRLGDFEMMIHQRPATTIIVEPLDNALDAPVEDLGQLSPLELINRLEHEIGEIEAFERNRETGANAMFAAAMRTTRPPQAASIVPRPHFNMAARPVVLNETLTNDLDELAAVLDQLSRELNRRRDQDDQRETEYQVAASQLVELQKKLAGQVELFAQLVSEMQGDESTPQHRASA